MDTNAKPIGRSEGVPIMASTMDPDTSSALLRRLRDWGDDSAWRAFEERYRSLILRWCRAKGLDITAADDTRQRALIRLARQIKAFDYDPDVGRFRGWLYKLVYSQIVEDLRARRDKPVEKTLGERADRLRDPAGEDDPDAGPDPLLALVEQVEAAARARVEPDTWGIYWMADREGTPLVDVARRFGKTYAAAFMACKRVRKLLREEGRKALEGLDGPGVTGAGP
jgi:RNA polymerase sigma-70 factor, ECF subfamily